MILALEFLLGLGVFAYFIWRYLLPSRNSFSNVSIKGSKESKGDNRDLTVRNESSKRSVKSLDRDLSIIKEDEEVLAENNLLHDVGEKEIKGFLIQERSRKVIEFESLDNNSFCPEELKSTYVRSPVVNNLCSDVTNTNFNDDQGKCSLINEFNETLQSTILRHSAALNDVTGNKIEAIKSEISNEKYLGSAEECILVDDTNKFNNGHLRQKISSDDISENIVDKGKNEKPMNDRFSMEKISSGVSEIECKDEVLLTDSKVSLNHDKKTIDIKNESTTIESTANFSKDLTSIHKNELEGEVPLNENKLPLERDRIVKECKRESPPKEKFAEFLEKSILSDDKIKSIIENLSLDKEAADLLTPNSQNVPVIVDDKPEISTVSETPTHDNDKRETDDLHVSEDENRAKLVTRVQKNPAFPSGLNFGSVIGELKNKTKNGGNGATKPESLNASVDEKKKTPIDDNELGQNILADRRNKLEIASQASKDNAAEFRPRFCENLAQRTHIINNGARRTGPVDDVV
ncbi:hypothetical protein EVAR_10149_1 [Eumeta japonica]|uniref:Uncharacterized protein n=1 Tax=Eumeta variegata TaxID=151549 RepID=A0A4C1UCE7_EUMVA|nr:hypothetical protein EVAR_10149_1 [Eumeta japonica]